MTKSKRKRQTVREVSDHDQKWLVEMKGHFLVNGAYRPEDLQRVLGEPWDRVDILTSADDEMLSRLAK